MTPLEISLKILPAIIALLSFILVICLGKTYHPMTALHKTYIRIDGILHEKKVFFDYEETRRFLMSHGAIDHLGRWIARLTRQQARDSAISLLEDAAKQEDADKEVANQASESIQVLASYTLKEAQIENLVTAKGYTDCVAFMGDDSLSIVVSTADGTLNSTDVAKITDIAMTETGYAASAIRIMASN